MFTKRALTVFSLKCAVAVCALMASPARTWAAETVPLAVAVQDAVPAGRVVVYSPAVDMSVPVQLPDSSLDWNGRVRAMAAQVGLAVKEDDNVLFIGPAPADVQQRAQEAWVATVASLPPDTEPLKIVEEDVPAPLPVAPAVVTAKPEPAVSPPVPSAPVSAPSVRLGEGTLMGAPRADARAVRSIAKPEVQRPAQKTVASLEPVAPQPLPELAPVRLVEGTLMGKPTEDPRPIRPARPVVQPVMAEPKPVLTPAPVAPPVAPPVAAAPEMVPLATLINRIRPGGGRVVYASNVDKSARVPVPPEGTWQEKMAAIARAGDLRIEDLGGTLFVNRATQVVSLDPSYPRAAVVAPVAAPASEPDVVKAPEPEVAKAPEVPAPTPSEAASEPVALTPTPSAADEPAPALAQAEKPSFWARLGLWEDETSDGGAGTEGRQEAAVTVQPAPAAPLMAPEPPSVPKASPAEPEPMLAAAPVIAPRAEKVETPPENPTPTPVEADIAARAAPIAPDMTAAVGSNFEPAATRPVPAAGNWRAERGSSLHDVLSDWCQRAGVQLVWSSQFDFPLQASIALDDSFEGAVRTLLSGFASAAPRPVGRLHRQANFGTRVLVIQTNGNRYGE